PFGYEPALRQDLKAFLAPPGDGPLVHAFLASIPRPEQRTVDFLVGLNQRLWREIKYVIRPEAGVQTPEETLRLRSGSCRDSAWLLASLLRHLGLAARFVSGYLIQLRPDIQAGEVPTGTKQDFTDLHAWCEVYLPGAGWVGLDPTSGLLAGEGHLPLACTPEPSTAAPITGTVDECQAEFEHGMRVTRIYESPRVTQPYTEAQWSQIESLGQRLDAELKAGDVRLTMGGEPTFIAMDNMDGTEWNFTALGPEKQRLADALVRRLKQRLAPGGLLHFGQGKWYPGESLPRWAYGCYWRKDGQPIWHDDTLLAESTVNYGYGETEARRFIALLARILDVKVDYIMPAYEDAWYYLWRERRLPTNVDPLESNLEDPEERARLARVFTQGLNRVVGYALPLTRPRVNSRASWTSGPWFLRREHCFLTPGDSPMGLRLPLDSIPWVRTSDYPYLVQPDLMADFPPLPKADELRQLFLARAADSDARPAIEAAAPSARRLQLGTETAEAPASGEAAARIPASQQSADWITRTALCVEPRQGRLYLFMPPVASTEDYLNLISAVEETATELRLPVIVEGEKPPLDPRVRVIRVTPDPGVIEVNVPPAADWEELAHTTEILYEEARRVRLGTEKFMMDGRHVGTGGGNHIVVGGETPGDSPLLRRPDLVRSLLCYWQNHPSLSFLFSSQFIGPTSQHPRVDEARNDSLYELAIAFRELDRQLEKAGAAPASVVVPPWLVDRLFRHLLIDATGNTHRAEFCIDKLYAPESSTGRLGLLELRAFEMPPHPRMSLTQNLLLRSLMARFWRTPYYQTQVCWRTELHDRFMLPHFVEQDFGEVIADLNEHGYPLEHGWFAPHGEFRFPKYGDVTYRGVNLEVRQALEPWHVLGEQGSAGAAVRYVDSSLERLQLKVRGLTDTRHVLAVNGRRVPLHPTGTEGEFVAGVRFRAWQPPECLHPTIGVQSPLTFDLVDTWNGRSIGGCTYHVSHPGGLSYTSLPVNAYEAESRRLSRFIQHGHTPGPMTVPPNEPNAAFPFTLDLRWEERASGCGSGLPTV
ncbi:MAG: transglutaminase family protein, partial [Terriglobales bacterium]